MTETNVLPESGKEATEDEASQPRLSSKRQLFGNIASLSILQGANYLLPLITVPYLVRTLGADRFGLIAFAQAFSQYFAVLTDYGFNMTAVPRIALCKDDRHAVSAVFTLVMLVKLSLMLFSFLLMTAIVFTVPGFSADGDVFFICFLMVIGNALFPMWLFQGLEEMKYITILNVTSKAVTTLSVFVLVHSRDDYLIAAAVQSGGYVLAGMLGLYVAWRKLKIHFVRLHELRDVRETIRESGQMFIATISGSIYSQGAVLVTGLIAGHTAAGYFAVAQKIGWAISSLAQPVAQATYPRLCALYARDARRHNVVNRRFLFYGAIFSGVLAVALFVAAWPVVKVVTKDAPIHLVTLIRAYTLVTFFTTLNVLLTPLMLSMKAFKGNQRLATIGAIVFLVSSVPLTSCFGSIGMAVTMLIVELTIFLGIVYITRACSWSRTERAEVA